MTETIKADYLIVGAGAMGMAFADVLMTETEATIVMVDRHHRPGGHWNDAYPFVRLHQPSAFYGVNSRPLGNDTIDQVGLNKGLFELASSAEVCTYFDQVMQQQFLPSGRVQFLPMSEYRGDGRVTSRVTDQAWQIEAIRVVDATYMDVSVPAIRSPLYDVGEGVNSVPINGLATVVEPFDRYVVVGGGKTSMDACLWLLQNKVNPDNIVWIRPRDSWILNRANIQPGALARATMEGQAKQSAAIDNASNLDEMFAAIEAAAQLLRIDQTVRPTMYRCATCTVAELEELRRIKNVVRQGHVTSITPDRIVLESGEIETSARTLHVDCSADGLARRPQVPVFAGSQITLQSVRTCQQVFSAAFIAHVEAAYPDEATKNDLCRVVPHPDTHIDFLRTTRDASRNQVRWARDHALTVWLGDARLDGFSAPQDPDATPSPEQIEAIRAMTGQAPAYTARLNAMIEAAVADEVVGPP